MSSNENHFVAELEPAERVLAFAGAGNWAELARLRGPNEEGWDRFVHLGDVWRAALETRKTYCADVVKNLPSPGEHLSMSDRHCAVISLSAHDGEVLLDALFHRPEFSSCFTKDLASKNLSLAVETMCDGTAAWWVEHGAAASNDMLVHATSRRLPKTVAALLAHGASPHTRHRPPSSRFNPKPVEEGLLHTALRRWDTAATRADEVLAWEMVHLFLDAGLSLDDIDGAGGTARDVGRSACLRRDRVHRRPQWGAFELAQSLTHATVAPPSRLRM